MNAMFDVNASRTPECALIVNFVAGEKDSAERFPFGYYRFWDWSLRLGRRRQAKFLSRRLVPHPFCTSEKALLRLEVHRVQEWRPRNLPGYRAFLASVMKAMIQACRGRLSKKSLPAGFAMLNTLKKLPPNRIADFYFPHLEEG
jgi:hypothetical protein